MNVPLFICQIKSLIRQLANRTQSFHRNADSYGTRRRNVGWQLLRLLAGKKGIGAEATALLLMYTSMTQRQAVAAFSKPVFSAIRKCSF